MRIICTGCFQDLACAHGKCLACSSLGIRGANEVVVAVHVTGTETVGEEFRRFREQRRKERAA